jgi:hypothetical protein
MRARLLWKAFPITLLGLLAALAGCAVRSAGVGGEASDEYVNEDMTNGLVNNAARELASSPFDSGLLTTLLPRQIQAPPKEAAPDSERLLIQRAELRLATSSPEDTGKAAAKIAKELGGYAQSTSYETVVLRIPAKDFDEALDRLAKLGHVLARSVHAEDVTEEVVDVRLRLKNALALRDRLAQLIEKAEKIEDILKIEAELTRLRTEVEKLEGRLKVLEHRRGALGRHVEPRAAPRGAADLEPADPVGAPARHRPAAREALSMRFAPLLLLSLASCGTLIRAPEAWITLDERPGREFEAVSAQGSRLVVRHQKNERGGTLAFWTEAIRRELMGRGYTLQETHEVATESGRTAPELLFWVSPGIRPHLYLLAVFVEGDEDHARRGRRRGGEHARGAGGAARRGAHAALSRSGCPRRKVRPLLPRSSIPTRMRGPPGKTPTWRNQECVWSRSRSQASAPSSPPKQPGAPRCSRLPSTPPPQIPAPA